MKTVISASLILVPALAFGWFRLPMEMGLAIISGGLIDASAPAVKLGGGTCTPGSAA